VTALTMEPAQSDGFFAALAPQGRRVAMPAAIPGLTALAILCWLYTWNEFLFALILTAHETPILTVVMAQFVHELGMEWNLMSATAVIALVPALIVTLFGQKYVIRGLRI